VLAPVVVVITLAELHAHLIGHYPFTGTSRFSWTLGYIVLLEFGAYVMGLLDARRTTLGAFWAALGAAGSGAVAVSVIQLITGALLLPREVVLGSAVLLVPVYGLLALAAQRVQDQGGGQDRVLAVLGPDEAAALESDLDRGGERPVNLVAVLHPGQASAGGAAGGDPDGGSAPRPLVEAARRERATVIVLGREAQADEAVVAQAATIHGGGVRVRTLTLFYDEWLEKLPVSDLERLSLMFDIQELHAPRYARLKRIIDLVAGMVGLVLFAAAFPLVWLLDRFGNRGPVLYRQARVGKGGREFTILKFRTMAPGGESEWTGTDDPRLGTVGRWMRRVHLDELPQSVNVLRGQLSLVGPRPEQPRYVAELTDKIPFYDVRHLVQPGITGWAQVKFPYGASVQDALEKLQYEFFYLRHQGPVLDTRILARTLRAVVRLQGR
jgi:lipopolysaccharide/colanic/teichoic acid biosynthesis glycosyltransferase